MNMSIEDELERLRKEKKRAIRDFAIATIGVIALVIALLMFDGRITGYSTLETFESENQISGSSAGQSLSFEKIPNFIAKVGEKYRFKVDANRDDVIFRDDTAIFDITEDGIIEFTPEHEDNGKHNVWVIIKDDSGNYHYQNVIMIIEE